MPRGTMRNSIKEAASEGRRRGVVLGLTIAEIILLILFALLLAMTGILIKRQIAVKAEYEAQASARVMTQILTPEISGKLQAMKIDLTQPGGEERLLAILNAAQSVTSLKKTKDSSALEQACQAGLELQNALGDNLNLVDFTKLAKQLSQDLANLRIEAQRSIDATIAPPCFDKTKGDPSVYIYDLQVTPTGIIMTNTVPEKYRNRFEADFKKPPPVNKVLSDSEFQAATKPFITYGKKNQCKFYVKVYDETEGNKDKFRKSLKVIEDQFVWTFMMSGKVDEAGKSINLFPTEPIKVK